MNIIRNVVGYNKTRPKNDSATTISRATLAKLTMGGLFHIAKKRSGHIYSICGR